jgi:hypothetical protein
LEEITPNDDVLKEIIDVDMSYCQYHIDLFQKDLDKYTEMYFEVVNPSIKRSSLPKKVKINGSRGGRVTRKK